MSLGEVFTAAGYATGLLVFYVAARRHKRDTEGTAWLVPAGLFGGVVGARLAQWGLVGGLDWSGFLDPRQGGRALLGGVLGGWLAVELAKKRLGMTRSTGDLFALAIPAGVAVGRLGCFLNQCCYGAVTEVPWAVLQHGALRHPTQLYEALVSAGLFLWLWSLQGRLPREGDLFRLYLFSYSLLRFVLEFFRQGSPPDGLSLAQGVCLQIAGATLLWHWISRRQSQSSVEVK